MTRFFSIIFNSLSAAIFVVIGWFLIYGQAADWSSAGRMTIAFFAAIFCAVVGNLDRIESIKATLSGIEAKTREVKAVVAEAKHVIEALHTLAEMTGATLVDLIGGEGRWGGGQMEAKAEQRASILRALTELGLSADAIRRVGLADQAWVKIDYALGIFNLIDKSSTCSKDLKQERTKMLKRWNDDDFRPTPDDFKRMFEGTPCDDSQVMDLLEDYRHYTQHGEHRRPDVWRDRKDWLR